MYLQVRRSSPIRRSRIGFVIGGSGSALEARIKRETFLRDIVIEITRLIGVEDQVPAVT